MAKEKKKKGKGGKVVAGAGILAIIAAIFGLDLFGLGIGLGAGSGAGTGSGTKNEGRNEDYLMQDNQMPTVVPPATVTPAQEQEETPVIQLKEIAVQIKDNKVVYNGQESSAQELADTLAAEFAEEKENILVKVTLENAVYDTVEALKVALEGNGIKYQIAE